MEAESYQCKGCNNIVACRLYGDVAIVNSLSATGDFSRPE